MRSDPTILGFDTSAAHCAAALLQGDAVYGERVVEMARGQGEALMPLLEETLGARGLRLSDLDALAVGIGPGNFTGIRIGVSAARGLGLALGIPAIGVSMFDVMAFRTMGDSVLVSLPAPRNEVYVQPFRRGRPAGEARVIDLDAPPKDLQMSFGMFIVGHRAGELARAFEASSLDAALEDIPRRLCLIAAQRLSEASSFPRPAPLYIRPADAAPSRVAAPKIIG
ncbi:MAG: tRNA (adenosine(37)-N6)-threonylcarbamoyltransferase complex dimerization subunit type 1 TsaB [Paracoccaceae bacterium]|nr:tRNA (adenosine(37)-N6)-threonylcarbamoyltransferase complex dimerization subunit type 1 TsaB [Paracoccaceae bacterium]